MKFFLGLANWANDTRDKYDGNQTDKTPTDTSKLNRKESYKAQRKNYRREKKRVRGTLKSWTKLWCVLKPGLLLLYKSPKTKSSHWVGTILLTSCQVIERPSKKDGFCFKLFHPLEQSIWAPRGPDKETIGAVVQPLPTSYLIFRAPSQAAGKCWMDALELSLRCSGLLLRSNSAQGTTHSVTGTEGSISHETQWSEADYEKHFKDQDLDGDSQNEAPTGVMSGIDTDTESDANDGPNADKQSQQQPENEDDIIETPYVPSVEEEINPETGEQVEELAEENKSLIWCLLKQVRPGMDLSKVTLPTFILEPRSFLDKLSDSYYHADILSCAVTEDDPFTRLKKPYNPILGETFRCYWEHQNSSRTYFIAEQVSHHPPVSAFYVTNRQEGFSISCSILAKSKFYGNSTSAVLDGEAKLTLLPRGECYVLNTPYAHCKGILMGTLSMELGGKISIECESTGYKTELEFKLKPFLGGADHTNCVVGKIKLVKEVLATIEGHWDGEMRIKDVKTGEQGVLFAATKDVMKQRLQRYIVPFDSQLPNESERLWSLVSAAIRRDDQHGATEEKTVLEEAQRKGAKERKATFVQWDPYHFSQDLLTGKYADLRPWDPRNDVKQYEIDYKVLTKTRHLAPMVRTASIVSVPAQVLRGKDSHGASVITKHHITTIARETLEMHSDSSQSQEEYPYNGTGSNISNKAVRQLMATLENVNKSLDEHTRQLALIHLKLERMQYAPHSIVSSDRLSAESMLSFQNLLTHHISPALIFRSLVYLFGGIILSLFLRWLLYP
uniref:Oxysterol-binding protein n=1 Tax=Glossina austeni TaxID=7395 RepID=A0A1A9UF02_GLOAU